MLQDLPTIAYHGETDTGNVRPNNEDLFLISKTDQFCLVADGMGGAAAGEVASRIFSETASQTFAGHTGRSQTDTIARIQAAFKSANDNILQHVARHPHDRGMGCTADLLAFSENMFFLGHVGDSRTYRLRDNHLKQLTKDHSLVQEQVDQGMITSAEARSHRMRNVILRAVGVNKTVALDILKAKLKPGDVFMLCSDGLTDMIDDSSIQAILAAPGALRLKAQRLIMLAKQAGGKDNVTVVLAAID